MSLISLRKNQAASSKPNLLLSIAYIFQDKYNF